MSPTRTPEYRAWINMKSRCNNQKTPGFHRYGGRGIKVCDEWLHSFEAFFAELGPRPSVAHSVDRIDGNRGYEPGNCRWATRAEQAANLSTNRLVPSPRGDAPLSVVARQVNIKANTLLYRLRRGWSVDQALKLPIHKGKRP